MTEATLPVAATRPSDGQLQRVWPGQSQPMPSTSLGLAAAAGVSAAVLLPDTAPGLALFGVGALVAGAALTAARGRVRAHELGYGALAALLLTVVVVRDAEWVVALSLLATVGTASYALSGGRTVVGALLGCMSLPVAAVRSLPWMGRGLARHVPADQRSLASRAARSTAVTVGLVVAFGALFASADAVFASLLPDFDLEELPLRGVLLVVFAALAAAAAFLAAAPPRWDVLAPGPARSVRTVEWVVPIGALALLFAVFVGVQLTTLFGGNDHVLRTAGLTHAEYARSGFGQLVAVTLLTLTVVSGTARWAPRERREQRIVLRGLLGLLCALTLVVVASALHRLHLYEEAFGFTRLRLFMNVFETWLGVLVLLVMVAGVRLRAGWLTRGVIASGAVALLSLAAINPDAYVAERNVDRYLAIKAIDVAYLRGLSADAVPAVDRLPEPVRSCALQGIGVPKDDGLAGWNLGRERARSVLSLRPGSATCDLVALRRITGLGPGSERTNR